MALMMAALEPLPVLLGVLKSLTALFRSSVWVTPRTARCRVRPSQEHVGRSGAHAGHARTPGTVWELSKSQMAL